MENINRIKEIFKQSINLKNAILSNKKFLSLISEIVDKIVLSLQSGGKVLLCGNGGSAADAQHIAAELSGKFYFDRPPLPAEALHVNTSFLTAVANDYSYEQVFSRMLKAIGKENDILIAISTSGNSINIINALKTAKEIKMLTIGLTGSTGGKMKELCDYIITVPSEDTPRIQEIHILIGHILCELIEHKLFK